MDPQLLERLDETMSPYRGGRSIGQEGEDRNEGGANKRSAF